VVFVPGYGMATAQAQHALRELTTALEEAGVTVNSRSTRSPAACPAI
jgi:NAD/NADP transhydrogenase beta subunit